jgi:hypothetical protein
MMKSRRMRWGGHAARTKKRNPYRILVEKLEDLSVGGRIILKWILEKRMGWYGLDWFGSG